MRPRQFTGRDAVMWGRSRPRLDEKEAEAFAADIEAGRKDAETAGEFLILSDLTLRPGETFAVTVARTAFQ